MMKGILLDLPDVIPAAHRHILESGLENRCQLTSGSFRENDLPKGADAISLIRVLFDHEDEVVADLLRKSCEALPAGGRLIISEPMSGGARPDLAGDVYFSFYTMAMGTGRVRSGKRIAEMCEASGFTRVKLPNAFRPYVTSTLVCRKP
jgi:demethylspheroidene O-methyltransferase